MVRLLSVAHALLPFQRYAIFHEHENAGGSRRTRHWHGHAEGRGSFVTSGIGESALSASEYLEGFLTDDHDQHSFRWRDIGAGCDCAYLAPSELHTHMRGAEGLAGYIRSPLDGSSTLLQLECETPAQADARPLLVGVIASYVHTVLPAVHEQTMPKDTLPASFTPKERDVLRWVLQGKTSWEIGRILSISERTVKFHLKNVYQKLNVSNRAQAVALVTRLKLA